MAISTSPVQQATASQGSGTSLVVTLGAAPAAGNALIVGIGANADIVSSISGCGATWTRANSGFSFYDGEVWIGENCSGSGTSVTITMASSTRAAANVSEWSGIKTSASIDTSIPKTSGTSTSASPGAIDPTAAPCLYYAVAVCNNSTFTSSVGGGFTQLTDPAPAGGALSVECAYKVDNAAHVAATPTFGILASAAWEGVGASFLGAAGGTPIVVNLSPVALSLFAPIPEGISSSSTAGRYHRRRLLMRF